MSLLALAESVTVPLTLDVHSLTDWAVKAGLVALLVWARGLVRKIHELTDRDERARLAVDAKRSAIYQARQAEDTPQLVAAQITLDTIRNVFWPQGQRKRNGS